MQLFVATWMDLQPWAQAALGLGALSVLAMLAGGVARLLLLRVVRHGRQTWASGWLAVALHDSVLVRLAKSVPSMVVQQGVYAVPHLADNVANFWHNAAAVFTTYHLVRAVCALLDAANVAHDTHDGPKASQMRTIKSYVQLGKLVVWTVGLLLMAAVLLNRSPLLLLSGLGAMSAVLMLVFKDTILSFVAGVQLASNDMLRVGDWIEMPKEGADGAVVDIALNTVKVQNWDKTITTIPTWKLMSESFKNWRAMFETGGRRIMRALHIDAATVSLLAPERRTALVRQGLLPADAPAGTNLAALQAYTLAYLQAHPEVAKGVGMHMLVRTLEPTAMGIPLQLYCYSANTAWAEYERIQGSIFDHLMGVLPQFGLALYQRSSDYSNRQIVDALLEDSEDATSAGTPAQGLPAQR